MTWHTLFGIEVSLEALLSPPHLLLALGGGLLVTVPLRAALNHAAASAPVSGARSFASQEAAASRFSPVPLPACRLGLPALLSLSNLVSLIAFFTAYMHPFVEISQPVFPGSLAFRLIPLNPSEVVGAVLLQSIVLMAAVLLLVRSFRLPFGSLTLLFALTTLLAASQRENWGLIPVAILGGLAADALVQLLHPARRGWGMRLFAFLVPAVLYLLYFTALKLQGTFDWSFELWGGAILLAGFAGWLLSYAFFQELHPFLPSADQ